MVALTGGQSTGRKGERLGALFDCLASSRRRQIVRLVAEQAPEPVSRDELATALAAATDGTSRDEVTAAERQRAATALHHKHLPQLAAADLVEYEADDETVALADHPVFEDPEVLEIVDGDTATDEESLDALFQALADERRRTILDVLSHQMGPIHAETLARELEADERDVRESDVPSDAVDALLVRLYHVHLPCLGEAGLIEYDADDGMVEYTGHPHLRVPWMHSVLRPDFRQSLTGEADADGIGEIEGRKNVVSFGQSLFDEAEDELFCMFTDTQLLEAGCLTRLKHASDRGADVYLGTRDPDVREYVRENAPEVILWEPNTDWLNLPAAGDRVGRLVLADREAVMLGTLQERTVDGVHDEQAIIGEGEHNTLVTMICQLLAPHLEEIDKETDDIAASLPV